MKKKLNVGILFGGKSAEHEVSLQSAKNVLDAIDKKKYNPILIGIDKNGKWFLHKKANFLLNSENPKLIKLNKSHNPVSLTPQSNGRINNLSHPKKRLLLDVIFPVLHGPFGEDGTIQGLLKLANVPFVGSGVLGSAVGMDKDIMRRLLRDADLPIAKFLVFENKSDCNFNRITKKFNLPFFVKPANLGSSVGVNKVNDKKDFSRAINNAFRYDKKILVEEYIDGREIECSVLGNENPIASVPGEIILKDDFYSYKTKYISKTGAKLEIPAKINQQLTKKVQTLAIKTFKVLACEGLSRVDFFLKKDGKVIINEINTIPGFTSISMYPRLWKASGVSYSKLIDQLIKLAIQRFKKEQKLKHS
ncbi:MAG: D-alanine--D-alanine ligase [Patescibacteria group bacterium]|nr:D-alanine--D-alanine ligase [Patescibacteria group bacterium]